MKKFKYTRMVIIGLVVIVVVPILLNCILVQQRFCDNIIGNDETWLTFWGSYLGSIIAILIPLYALYKQIQSNQYENDKERKYQEIVRLKTELAEMLSKVDFSQITESVLEAEELVPMHELHRLNDLYLFYTEKGNTMKVLYGFSRRSEEREIADEYYRCIECATCVINDLTKSLAKYPRYTKLTTNDLSDYKSNLQNVFDRCNDIQKRYIAVGKMVVDYIQTIEMEYTNLK